MDICHLKNGELEPQYQKYRDGDVLRGDTVEDDSGADEVFSEQGSSPSQLTAAKVMDVIARLPDWAGQATDAVSACTQVPNGWRAKTAKNPKVRNVQIFGSVFDDSNDQNVGQASKTQWFLLNEICTDIQLLISCGKGSSRRFCWNLNMKKYRIGNVCLFIESKVYSYPYMWMALKWLERRKTSIPCGRNWRKMLILMNEHHFLAMKTWDALNVNVKRMRVLLANNEKFSYHEFLRPQLKNCQGGRNLTQKLSRGHIVW